MGGDKQNCDSRQIIRYNSKSVQDRYIVSIKVEQVPIVVCTLLNGDTVDDLELP